MHPGCMRSPVNPRPNQPLCCLLITEPSALSMITFGVVPCGPVGNPPTAETALKNPETLSKCLGPLLNAFYPSFITDILQSGETNEQ